MPRLANLAAIVAALGPTLATAGLSDRVYTETLAAHEVGSTTMGGTMVYSMNHCSIIHSTQCYTSLSTGGPAPTSGPDHASSSSSSSPSAPTYGQSDGSGSSSSSSSISRSGSAPVPTTVSSGSTVQNPSTTPAISSESVSGEYTSTTATASEDGGSSSTRIPNVPTGAAVMGASVMGNVLVVAALAALVV